jgi:hypothetical protein
LPAGRTPAAGSGDGAGDGRKEGGGGRAAAVGRAPVSPTRERRVGIPRFSDIMLKVVHNILVILVDDEAPDLPVLSHSKVLIGVGFAYVGECVCMV